MIDIIITIIINYYFGYLTSSWRLNYYILYFYTVICLHEVIGNIVQDFFQPVIGSVEVKFLLFWDDDVYDGFLLLSENI